jgi:hypothetical protein
MSEKEWARFLLKTDAAIFEFIIGLAFILLLMPVIYRQWFYAFFYRALTSSFFVTPRKLFLQIKSSSLKHPVTFS